ncbi:MAG: iron transporter, partial [Solirubrobacterales bacterium]
SGTAGTEAAGGGSEVPAGVAKQYAAIEQEVDAEGGETTSGPWGIAYIVEPAEGWFDREGDEYRWRPPAAGETHHIEILPIEAETGRVVPDVPVTLEVLDADGQRIARKPLRFYYAEFFHYASNFSIPKAGDYTLRATIEPPPFPRHGEQAEEPALADGAEVEFDDVRLEPEEG